MRRRWERKLLLKNIMTQNANRPGHLPVAFPTSTNGANSADARSLRIISEYLYPLSHFRHEKIHDTVVFFGSARIFESSALGRYYKEAQELAKRLTLWSNSMEKALSPVSCCSGGGPRDYGGGQSRRARKLEARLSA